MFTNAAKLVYCTQSSQNRVLFHPNVTGQRAVVREDHVISDIAIMGDMAVGQKITVVSDASYRPNGGSSVYRAKFPEAIVITDLEVGRFAGIFQILRLLANRAEGVKRVSRTDRGGTENRYVILQPTALP
jgi:hypothetical protein